MTVPAAVPKTRIAKVLKWLNTSWMYGPHMSDQDHRNYDTLAPALERLQHLEQLAERMTGAREALEDGAKSLESDAASWRKDCGSCAPAISRESSAAQLRSLIASLGEGK
jgi:hypothetical protein